MTKEKIKETVTEMIDSLNGRGGFDGWWGNIDEDIQEEILEELEDIITKKLNDE